MGRLRGWVRNLGIPASVLLAYMWMYPLAQTLPEGAQMPELSRAEKEQGGDRFKRLKQGMSDAHSALFPFCKAAEGQGHRQFWVRCWEGFQLLLGKLRNKGEASHACMQGFFLLIQHTQTAHKFLLYESKC